MKKLLLRAFAALVALAVYAAVIPDGVTSAEASVCTKKVKKSKCRAPAKVAAAPRVYVVQPPPTPIAVVPGLQPGPMVFYHGDPAEAQAARDGCRLVHDARLLHTYQDGQTRYHWRGTDWAFLPPKPSEASRICTRNGHLSWWKPPGPRPLQQVVPNGQAAPAAPGGQ